MNDVVGARILVIDDTPENLQVVSAVLRGAGYAVNVAKSGEQGLEIARRSTPNLILLDLVMPGMDGFATCRALREVPSLKEVPVIFLTASRDTTDVVRGFEEGAVDYVTKPFHAPELLSRVQTHVQLRTAREKLATLASQLARYLSPQVHAKIFSGEQEVRRETRRRPLTVFFSDIVGFTARTEAMGDAELAAWLNDYLDQMAQVAQRHGGTVDKFIGDAVMVFFGDPNTAGLAEDTRRCLRMAREMLEVARACRTQIRIGVHAGECVVGNFGSEEQMNYTIIGKVVNAAARLQGASAPGRILVSDDIRTLAGSDFGFEPRGPIALRGMARPMETFWVTESETLAD